MKKVLYCLAMAAFVIGISGCMDDPDGSQQKLSSTTYSMQL